MFILVLAYPGSLRPKAVKRFFVGVCVAVVKWWVVCCVNVNCAGGEVVGGLLCECQLCRW